MDLFVKHPHATPSFLCGLGEAFYEMHRGVLCVTHFSDSSSSQGAPVAKLWLRGAM
jgi:hypothetical protein